MQFRFVVEGKKFTAQYRPDGKGDYLPAFGGNVPVPSCKLPSRATTARPTRSTGLRFKDFRIVELPRR